MRVIAVGDFCKTGSGGTPSRSKQSEYYNGGAIPWIKSGELAQSTVDSAEEFITEKGLADSSAKLLQPGAILIAMYGATVGQVSRLAIPAATNQAICHIYPDKTVCSPDYLYRVLKGAKGSLLTKRVGGGQPNISQKIVRDLQIPLPPLAEQKRIAGILDAADALRAKRRDSLDQLDTLLQSTFLDMFGDPVTNPMGWEVQALGDLAATKPNNGVFRKNPEYSENGEGLPVVWVEELFRGNEIDTSNSRRLETTQNEVEKYGLRYGDVLFCRSSLKLDGIAYNNVYLGNTNEALFECHLIRVSPNVDICNPMFLSLQLRSIPMRALLKSKSKTATMTTIDQKALSSVEVVCPPLDLQHRFAAIVESVEHQKASQRAHLAELDTLFASLQSRAFNGEV